MATKRENVVVASYGGGVNSKWLIARWVTEKRPLHIALFADTGRGDSERPETYADVKSFIAWLADRGVPCITVRVSGETLEENSLRRKALPAIAYGFKTCSLRWKKEPQEKFLNNWIVSKDAWERGEKITKLIGFHAGEPQRANSYEDDKYVSRYPLIEWGDDYEACQDGLRSIGLCVPPKSSCYFCPNMSETEILDLKDEHPELLDRALKMEANAELIQIKGLGRDFSWKSLIEYDRDQLALLPKRDRSQPCDCYTGE